MDGSGYPSRWSLPGMEVVTYIENLDRDGTAPVRAVTIIDCGEVADEPAKASKADGGANSAADDEARAAAKVLSIHCCA